MERLRTVIVVTLLASGAAVAHAETECWAPTREEDSVARPPFRALRRALLEAERVVRGNAAFMAAPEPVRMRSTIAAGPEAPANDARLHVTAYPEKSAVGIQVWTGKCEVIPQADRIAAGAGQISIFLDHGIEGSFLGGNARPELTGRHGGYPEYNGWIVITKGGRLPWIPQTLDDKLAALGERRARALADWRKTKAARRMPEEATIQRTYAMLKTRDPAGAERYLASMRQLAADIARAETLDARADAHFEGQVAAVARARASFTAAQLRMPAVWRDAGGDGKRRLDERIRRLRELPAEIEVWRREARDLERQAKGKDAAEAARLRAQAADLANRARDARKAHEEAVAIDIQAALAEYDLENLAPGDERHAMGFKVDPSFPAPGDPAIQVVTVYIDTSDRRHGRDRWMKQAKETLDYAALAALLD